MIREFLSRGFDIGIQLSLIVLMLIIPTTYRWVLWEYPLPQSTLFVEFRGILIFLFDIPLLSIMTFSVIQFVLDSEKLAQVILVTKLAIDQYAGYLWLIFFTWLSISIFWSPVKILAIYHVIHIGAMLVSALIIASYVSQNKHLPLLLSFLAGSIFQAQIAVFQHLVGGSLGLSSLGELYFIGGRAQGLTVNANNLSGYLIIALFVSLYVGYKWISARIFVGFCICIVIGGLIVTGSRTTFLALGLTVGIIIFYVASRSMSSFKNKSLLFIICGMISIGIVLPIVLLRGLDTNIMLGRLTYSFSDTFDLIATSPWIGSGIGNSMIEIGEKYRTQTSLSVRLPAHNAYLMIAAEVGIVGAILYILAFFRHIWCLVQGYQYSMGRLILGAIFLCIFIINIFDYYFWGDVRSQMLFFILPGWSWGEILSSNQSQMTHFD